MSLTRVHHFSVSLDGFATGADQAFDAPFGHAGSRLLDWFGPTRLGRQVHGVDLPADRGVNDALVSAGVDGSIGAEIMGRLKFTPQTGPWADDEMKGGTTFHFIDASPEEALAQAKEAAGGLDVRIGGGPTTVRQFLAHGLVDHLHVVLVPILLGRGERLWDGLEGMEADFDVETVTSSTSPVTHLIFQRRS